MNYKILVDGQEHVIKKQITAHNREADNKAREEIIKHYLDTENANLEENRRLLKRNLFPKNTGI